MKNTYLTLGAALVAGALLSAPAEAKKGRPSKGKSALTATATDEDASGKVDVKFFPATGKRAERSWLRFKLKHLAVDGTYSLWMDDPATVGDNTLVEVTGVTFDTGDDENVSSRIDTKKGGTLPFGATLTELAGLAFEIRDGTGAAVLTGTVPEAH